MIYLRLDSYITIKDLEMAFHDPGTYLGQCCLYFYPHHTEVHQLIRLVIEMVSRHLLQFTRHKTEDPSTY